MTPTETIRQKPSNRLFPGSLFFLLGGACAVLSTVSCATGPRAAQPAAAGPGQVLEAPALSVAGIQVPDTAYVLGPGDEFDLRVWRHDELDRTLILDPAGRIHLPLAGTVRAAGLTLDELRELLDERFSTYLVDPQVDLNLKQVRSQRIHVLGEVAAPGTFTLDRYLIGPLEAIAKAGGQTHDANLERVLLIRPSGSEIAVAALDLAALLDGQAEGGYGYIRSGDVLYVPPLKIANVERFMTRLSHILAPIISVESAILLGDDVLRVVEGESDKQIVVTP